MPRAARETPTQKDIRLAMEYVDARRAWVDTQLTMLERMDALKPGTRIYYKEYLLPNTVPTYRSPWLPCGESWKRGIWS